MPDFLTSNLTFPLGPGTGALTATRVLDIPAGVLAATCHLVGVRWRFTNSDHKVRLIEVSSAATRISPTQVRVTVAASFADQNGDDPFEATIAVMVVVNTSAGIAYPQAFAESSAAWRTSIPNTGSTVRSERLGFPVSTAFPDVDQFIFGLEYMAWFKRTTVSDQHLREVGLLTSTTRDPTGINVTLRSTVMDDSPADDDWSVDVDGRAIAASNLVGRPRPANALSLGFFNRTFTYTAPAGTTFTGVRETFPTASPVFGAFLRSVRIERTTGDANVRNLNIRAVRLLAGGVATIGVETLFADNDGAEPYRVTASVTGYLATPPSPYN